MAPAPIKLAVGDAAPDFDLPLAGGGRVSLSELRGAPALLWFYPAANTTLCTTQACDLRDNHQLFLDSGYRVIGVSPDPVPELDRFVAEQNLPYDLASDESHEVMSAYGAWGGKNMYGRIVQGTIRSTFAIDPDGRLSFVRHGVATPEHNALRQEQLGRQVGPRCRLWPSARCEVIGPVPLWRWVGAPRMRCRCAVHRVPASGDVAERPNAPPC